MSDTASARTTASLRQHYIGSKRANWTAYVVTDLLTVAEERDDLASEVARLREALERVCGCVDSALEAAEAAGAYIDPITSRTAAVYVGSTIGHLRSAAALNPPSPSPVEPR